MSWTPEDGVEGFGMRALTLNQPGAHLLATGVKTIENRPWNTHYRGWFLIHSSKKMDPEMTDMVREFGFELPPALVHGAIVGAARLVDVISREEALKLPHTQRVWTHRYLGGHPDKFCWMIEEAVQLKPCLMRGYQGWWNPQEQFEKLLSENADSKHLALLRAVLERGR